MIAQSPPRLLEGALSLTLAVRDRETVVGDLREEYAQSVVPRLGRFNANLWYMRQVLSFVPMRLSQVGKVGGSILIPISLFALTSSCWLAVMEIVLRHPGYAERIGVALCVALVSVATIGARIVHLGARGERWLWAGAVLLIWVGGQAFFRDIRAPHFEGFAFLISLAFALQGILMLIALGRPSNDKPRGQTP